MAVPAHDQRDYEFAKKFDIEIIEVIKGGDIAIEAYEKDGQYVNSDFLNSVDNKKDGIELTINKLEELKKGEKAVSYKLREWIFARQRYWGEPVPAIHFEDKIEVLDDSELPLVLPELEDYKPSQKGQSPLEKAKDWVNVEKDGRKGRRETSTMPGSAGSSWYFLRYLDPKNENEIADKKLMEHWLPVDLYLGGDEHAVGHLLYSRMWNNYLYDKGIVPVKEPFKKLFHQGMILGANGEKMSKSKGNVVSPDELIQTYGADSLRIYEMFMGPLESDKPWSDTGAEASRKFLERVYRLYQTIQIEDKPNNNLERVYHQTVMKVTNDYNELKFNTAISQMMIFVNAVYKEEHLPLEYAESFIKLLNPLAPHITEEIWTKILKHNHTIAYEAWPSYDETKTVSDTYEW